MNNTSLRWKIEEYEILSESEKQVKVRVNALRPVTSRNGRRYTFNEMLEAGRTLSNKPINVNHNDQKTIGNTDWAKANRETQILEVSGTVNKEPYTYMVKTRDPRVKGWSVQADFRKAKCVHCPKTFDSMEALKEHLVKEEGIRNIEYEPQDIIFNALALVVDPEVPGVPNTSYEITESVKGFGSLQEMVDSFDSQPDLWLLNFMSNSEEQKKMSKIAVETQSSIAVGHSSTISQSAPTKSEAVTPTLKTSETLVVEEVKVKEQETTTKVTLKESKITKLAETAPVKLSLGEPFAGYTDFADCVSKNQDKGNPEAYCGSIKHETEGEMLTRKRLATAEAKLNEVIEELNKPVVFEHKETEFKDDLGWKEIKIPPSYDDKPIKEELSKLTEALKELPTLKETIARLDEKNTEQNKKFEIALGEAAKNITEIYNAKKELEEKLRTAETKKLAETQDLTTRVDNLEDKIKPTYKGKAKEPAKPATDFAYTPGGK